MAAAFLQMSGMTAICQRVPLRTCVSSMAQRNGHSSEGHEEREPSAKMAHQRYELAI